MGTLTGGALIVGCRGSVLPADAEAHSSPWRGPAWSAILEALLKDNSIQLSF